jgi:hypothetical protein
MSAAESRLLRSLFDGRNLAPIVPPQRQSGDWSLRRRRRQRLASPMFQVMMELHDWLGQRAGIAVCHPLLDRDVVAFCDVMPPEWIMHLGVRRRAFRDLVDSDTWLHEYLDLRALLRHLEAQPLVADVPHFDPFRQLGASAVVVARLGAPKLW